MKINSVCVGFLALESNFSDWFKEKGISVVDMKFSIILSVAQKNKEKCLLFYVRCVFSRGGALQSVLTINFQRKNCRVKKETYRYDFKVLQ
jgi:hypothetical protein